MDTTYVGVMDTVERILNLGGALTRSQWRDLYKPRSRTPEALLMLAILQQCISDWEKFKKDKNSRVKIKNAKEVVTWVDIDTITFSLVCEALEICGVNVDEDVFRSALKKYLAVDTLNGALD